MPFVISKKISHYLFYFELFMLSVGAFMGGTALGLYGSFFLLMSVYWEKEKKLYHSSLMIFFMYVSVFYFPTFFWKLPIIGFLFPFMASSAFVYFFNRGELSWLKKGNFDQVTIALMLVTSLVSALALILWAYWSENLGAGISMMNEMLSYPSWLIIFLVVPLFAIFNAFVEELVYRGVFQEGLQRILPENTLVVLALQSSAFAAAHVAGGFPNGKIGYLMTFIYAMVLGFLRKRSSGILAPYITHVLADLVIGYYLYFQAVSISY